AHDAGGLFDRHPGLVAQHATSLLAHHATSLLKKISVISSGVSCRISESLRTSPTVNASPDLFLSFRYSVERFIPNCFATVWIDRSRSTILAFSLLTLTMKPDLPCRTPCDRAPSFYTSDF